MKMEYFRYSIPDYYFYTYLDLYNFSNIHSIDASYMVPLLFPVQNFLYMLSFFFVLWLLDTLNSLNQ